MKNFIKNYWVWIALAVVLIVIGVVMYRSRKKRLEEVKNKIVEGATSQDASFPLQPYNLAGGYSTAKGSMGAQIKKLQEINNANNTYNEPLDVDGKYGPKSLEAFKNEFWDNIADNGTISKSQYEQILKKYNNK